MRLSVIHLVKLLHQVLFMVMVGDSGICAIAVLVCILMCVYARVHLSL